MLLCQVLFILFLPIIVKSEEPRCSKYDFEEKVLEKMVRIEFQMERMKSEIENMKTENDLSLKKQQEFEKNLKNKNAAALDEITKDLQTLKDSVVTPSVAFKATLNSDISVPTGRAIVFPNVLCNEGDAYNSGTGKFTASVSGTYMFSLAFCVRYHKTLVSGIMVDGKKYTVTLFYGDENHEYLTGDATAMLTAGQMVWVEAFSGTDSGSIIDQRSNRWNTFSGAFIH